MQWDQAWAITERSCGYTNHTLLAEALEKWPLPLFARLLPRHLEIVYEINRRFLDRVRERPSRRRRTPSAAVNHRRERRQVHPHGSPRRCREPRHQRCCGLTSELLKQTVLSDFHQVSPEKFLNITNGVTPRRWMVLSNPRLAALITSRIGDRWIADWRRAGRARALRRRSPIPRRVAAGESAEQGRTCRRSFEIVPVSWSIPDSLFDIQVKRLHEYKRQHLNVLLSSDALRSPQAWRRAGCHASHGDLRWQSRAWLPNGQADHQARQCRRRPPLTAIRMSRRPSRSCSFPDFNVSAGHKVYPAADLSEQISTAGKEASGTGNMKFAMNGALTIGTLDGANIEIRDAVGA